MSRVAFFCVLVLICVSLPGAFSQCHPRSPACLFDRGALGTVLGNTFFDGMGTIVPSTRALSQFKVSSSGDFAAVDIEHSCSFVLIDDVSKQTPFTLSEADVQALQDYYNAGGVIVLACEEEQFSTCPEFMNQILDRLVTEVSSSVRFSTPAVTVNPEACTRVTEAAGSAGSVLSAPNNLIETGFYSTRATTISIPDIHPNCIAGGEAGACIAAQAGQIVLVGDLNPFVVNRRDACATTDRVTDLGVNFGKLIGDYCSAGGAGGYVHVFPFDGTEIEVIFFDDQKNYLLYAAPELRVTISVTGMTENNFITAVGITLGSDQLLATSLNEDPAFYWNGELMTGNTMSMFGEVQIYEPDNELLRKTPGALSQFSRFISTGIKLSEVFNLVGGYHPGKGVYFNVEVRKVAGDSGLLTAVDSHRRDFRLPRRFEVASLF